MEGTLSQTSTRKKRPSATTNEIPTQRVESGPAFNFDGVNQVLHRVIPKFQIFNVELKSDGSKIPGSTYSAPDDKQDELFGETNADLALNKAFYDAGPVTKPNGCLTDILAQIQSGLNSFLGFINGLESTALGYIDPVRNLVVDISSDISIGC